MEGKVNKHHHGPDGDKVLQHGDQLHGGGGEEHREQEHTLDWKYREICRDLENYKVGMDLTVEFIFIFIEMNNWSELQGDGV